MKKKRPGDYCIPTAFDMPKGFHRKHELRGHDWGMKIVTRPPKTLCFQMHGHVPARDRNVAMDWIQEAIEHIRAEAGKL